MKVKLLSPEARVPKAQRVGDAGLDVYSPIKVTIDPGERFQIKLGIAVEVDPTEVILVHERSGMAINYGVHSIGAVIDSNYRGQISIILLNSGSQPYEINIGDRVGQLLVLKLGNTLTEKVDELSTSERGEQAHTSSGV